MKILDDSLLSDVIEMTDEREVSVSEPSELWLIFLHHVTSKKGPRISLSHTSKSLLNLADKFRFSQITQEWEAVLVSQAPRSLSTDRSSAAYCLNWLELSRQLHLSSLFEACLLFISLNLAAIDGLGNFDCCLASKGEIFRSCHECSEILTQPSALLLLREATHQLDECQTTLDGIMQVLNHEGLKIDLVQGKVVISDWLRWKRLTHSPSIEAAVAKHTVQRRSTCIPTSPTSNQ